MVGLALAILFLVVYVLAQSLVVLVTVFVLWSAGCYSDDMASIFANKVNKDYWDNSKISCTNTIRETSD